MRIYFATTYADDDDDSLFKLIMNKLFGRVIGFFVSALHRYVIKGKTIRDKMVYFFLEHQWGSVCVICKTKKKTTNVNPLHDIGIFIT